MEMMDKKEFKQQLIAELEKQLLSKLELVKGELQALKESSESDTKSSMGDKYETGREVMAQERSKQEAQMTMLQKQLSFLKSIDKERTFKEVAFGALVGTGLSWYFISISIGPMTFQGENVMVVSAASPIGQALLGCKVGEMPSFNGKALPIDRIF
ncbi:MAG: hypothetical protein Tsb0034_01300 [Ekhidna sp.]